MCVSMHDVFLSSTTIRMLIVVHVCRSGSPSHHLGTSNHMLEDIGLEFFQSRRTTEEE